MPSASSAVASATSDGHLQEGIVAEPLWQEREVRFDLTRKELEARRGERTLLSWSGIEDSKGNIGDPGDLRLTNLRLMWQSRAKTRISLSVGLGCIASVAQRRLHSRVRGQRACLHIMCRHGGTRYEFLFTSMDHDDAAVIQHVLRATSRVVRAFAGSRLFRELKLRSSAVVSVGSTGDASVRLLPQEQVYERLDGVWNLSADQGNVGNMLLTSVRVVWHATLNPLFNLSLPLLQVTGVRVRESKFGPALVLSSSQSSGGFVFGFRVHPPPRLTHVHRTLLHLYNVFAAEPVLGVQAVLATMSDEDPLPPASAAGLDALGGEWDTRAASEGNRSDAVAAYVALDSDAGGSSGGGEADIVFSPELGLAIERLRPGFTIHDLWAIVPED